MGGHIGERLDERAAADPDRVALVAPDGRSLSFGALRERAVRLSGRLDALGLAPAAHVLLLVPFGIGFYEALLGVFWGGRTAVLVDPSVPRARLDPALARVGLDALIGVPRAHLLRLRLRALRGLSLYASTRSLGPLARPIDGGAPGPLRHPPPGEPALITFTTGTTGIPKAMGRSHAFLLDQHHILAGHMGLSAEDVDLSTLPVFLLNSLAAGATCVLPDGDLRDVAGFDPARLSAQVRRHGVTSTSGSPAFFTPWVAALRAAGETLPTVRKLFVGGARVPAELLAGMQEVFPSARVTVLYGSTEAEPIASIDAREVLVETAARERAGDGACVGRPVPEVSVRLVDPDDGEDVADGEIDEVLVAGPNVNRGYYRDPSADAENKRRDGDVVWHRTGDAAWRDRRGRLWLVGRVAHRVGGLYPFPVELRAEQVAGVRRAGLAELDGEPVVAFEGEASLDAVRAATGVDEVRRVAAVPVDPRHRAKIDRDALAALLRSP